jgi:hypothetical protein
MFFFVDLLLPSIASPQTINSDMKCPFTGEECRDGVTYLGGGGTVCRQMGVLVCEGHIIRLRGLPRPSAQFKEVATSCISARECECFRDPKRALMCVAMVSTLRSGTRVGFCTTFCILDDRLRLLVRDMRVIQRSVRRWLKRLQFKRKVAVALEAYQCQYSPLNILPIDLFMDKIANQ